MPSDRSGNGWSSGGSKRKSAPTYGSPAASTRLATRNRSRGPSTGSSERSTTSSGPSSSPASSDSTSGTPTSQPSRSFSVPPASHAPTNSYDSPASASRTTGA